MRSATSVLILAAVWLAAGIARPAETIEHVVESGETLWSIAGLSDVYDDPYLWPVIYKFNRDQIKDPSRIYAGQRLQIPTHVAAEDRRASHAEARAAAAIEPPPESGGL